VHLLVKRNFDIIKMHGTMIKKNDNLTFLSEGYCHLEYDGNYTESHPMLLTTFNHILILISFKDKSYHILNP